LITVARVTLLYSTAREVYQYHLPLRAFLITATPSTEISTLSLHDALPICIGAGPHCDGQVLVSYDMLGLFDTFVPKFVRQYARLGDSILSAAKDFASDVRQGAYPPAAATRRDRVAAQGLAPQDGSRAFGSLGASD